MSDVVESKECNSSTASTPLQQVLDVLLKHRGSYEDHASHEVSGVTPTGTVTQLTVSKTKEEVFQLWERRSHRPILSLKTARKDPSAELDDTKQ